jgi:ABC-type nitrate/sulfonate/bicarbonate transport system substrate-binding protein
MPATARVAGPAAGLVAGLVAVTAALAGCGTGGGASPTAGSSPAPGASGEPRPLTLMLNWTPNAHHVGIYAALARGWYDEAGLDVRVVEPADAGVEQAVAAGAVQVGLAQAESLLPAQAAGLPVVSVATVLPVNDSALLSLEADGIARPRDLEGTRYGGYGGALETEILSSLVECDGGDPSAVEFVTLGNVDYLAGMQADRFDVAWVFSGWDALRAEQVEGVPVQQIRLDDWQDCIPNWYTPLMLTSRALVESDPALLRDFLAVTARGYDLAETDPQAAADLLVDQVPELDPQLVHAAVAYYAPRWREDGQPWGTQQTDTWQQFATFLTDSGVSERPLDGQAAFTNDLLPDG